MILKWWREHVIIHRDQGRMSASTRPLITPKEMRQRKASRQPLSNTRELRQRKGLTLPLISHQLMKRKQSTPTHARPLLRATQLLLSLAATAGRMSCG